MAAWAVAEVVGTAVDVAMTVDMAVGYASGDGTTGFELSVQAGGTAMGLFGPGAGYGTAAVASHVDDAARFVATHGDDAVQGIQPLASKGSATFHK